MQQTMLNFKTEPGSRKNR